VSLIVINPMVSIARVVYFFRKKPTAFVHWHCNQPHLRDEVGEA